MLDLCVINIIENFFYLYLLEIVFLQPVSHEDLSKPNKNALEPVGQPSAVSL